jgi:hypothetical protein
MDSLCCQRAREKYLFALSVVGCSNICRVDSTRTSCVGSLSSASISSQRIAGVGDQVVADAVTDGTGDNGIDAVYVDAADVVVLVQAKWSVAGTGSIGLGEARNFIAGLKDLTDERYDRFNSKFQSHVSELQAALLNPDVSFVTMSPSKRW